MFALLRQFAAELAQALALVGALLVVGIELERFVVRVVDKHVEMAAQHGGGGLQRVVRRHAAVGPDIQHELFVVRALADARVLHEEVDAGDGREDRINRYAADLLVWQLVAFGEAEATADAELAVDLEHAVRLQRADLLAGIQHFDGILLREVAGIDGARAFFLEMQRRRFARKRLQQDALEVEDDVGDIFRATLDRGEFVAHAGDPHARNGASLDGRKEHATERVSDRARIADFKRLGDEAGIRSCGSVLVLADAARHFKTAQTDGHRYLL